MSSTSRCLDRQLREALDLSVTCRLLSEQFRAADDPLMAVALARLSAELTDQVAALLPLGDLGADEPVPSDSPPPPVPDEPQPESDLAELGCRLVHLALVAESDAMEPGLEPPMAALLHAIGALYRSRRELLVLCTLVGSR